MEELFYIQGLCGANKRDERAKAGWFHRSHGPLVCVRRVGLEAAQGPGGPFETLDSTAAQHQEEGLENGLHKKPPEELRFRARFNLAGYISAETQMDPAPTQTHYRCLSFFFCPPHAGEQTSHAGSGTANGSLPARPIFGSVLRTLFKGGGGPEALESRHI